MHDGYVRVHAKDHPRSSPSNPYVFEHILVMEDVLGRRLLPHERVHHKNGCRDDNSPENLELWHVKDPPGVRAADYHCFGCLCSRAPSDTKNLESPEAASRISAGKRRSATGLQQVQLPAQPLVVRGECAWCRGRFEPKTDTQRCCSRSCARYYEGAYYFGGLGRGWKGGRVRHSAGYIWVFAPTHPRAHTTPYVFEHILVMERVLHRRLESTERVHHRNGKRDDNRPENLELWRMKDPSGVRAADYHCAGCACPRNLARLSEPMHAYRVGATLNRTWTTSPSLMT
ncbi:MAG TPA: HNH endonuclease [Candidatus Limnocylindria bacterium]|nr:HNH endonuclease [Candidatus Limnocylindria bacterium]